MLRPPALAARRLRAAARRRKSLAVAAPSTDGSSIPTAPGRLPLVGHALNFKPPKMHEYLEGVARDLDAWAFVAHFGPRTPVVVGDPALAQALLAPRSGWTGRSAAVLPFFRDSSDAIVGERRGAVLDAGVDLLLELLPGAAVEVGLLGEEVRGHGLAAELVREDVARVVVGATVVAAELVHVVALRRLRLAARVEVLLGDLAT